MKTIINQLITLFFIVLALSVNAQWTTQTNVNTLVSSDQTSDCQSIGTTGGNTWVVYWKEMPSPVYYEMRAQLLSSSGIGLLGPQGIVVNNTVAMSSSTNTWSVATDEFGCLYVGLNGSGTGTSVYVHKISQAGLHLWGTQGLLLGSGYDVKILPLPNGEAIASWMPGNEAVFQKINANGTIAWTSPVTVYATVTGHKTSIGELAAMTNSDFVLIIHDRVGYSVNSTMYAQRYSNSTGTGLWPALLNISTNATYYNKRYDAFSDQDTVYIGYSAATGSAFFSYLQRINPNGTIPWGLNGSGFSTQTTYYERATRTTYQPGSQYIWSMCEFTPSSQSNMGEYVQKFNKTTGARLLTNNAKMVFAIGTSDNSHKGRLQLLNDKPLFIYSDGTNNGGLPITLKVTCLDTNGNFAWTTQSLNMATYSSTYKSRVDFAKPSPTLGVCVWVEDRGSGSRIYAQNIVPCTSPTANFSFTVNQNIVNFTSTVNATDSVSWKFGDGNVGYGASISHTYLISGTYTVCQKVINSCGIDSICHTVVLCTPPTANFSFTVNKRQVNFSSTFSATDTVSWKFGDGAIATGANTTHIYADSGTYIVCMKVKNACGIDSICKNVIVACNIANASFTFNTNQLTVSFQNTSLNADSIKWNFGDGSFDTASAPIHSFSHDGTFQVCLTAKNWCSTNTYCQQLTVSGVGISDVNSNKGFIIYPNPVSDELIIEISDNKDGLVKIELYDLVGKSIYNKQLNVKSSVCKMNVRDFNNGVYLIKITDSSGKYYTSRIAINH
ncbi:MAG: PKD domain-containing protein [Bacteroidetes bacterium]|nr:PKD domain-containing protein [Bacteroidota bacterium]